MTTVKRVCGAELEVLELDVSLEAPVLDAELYGNELEAELPSGSALLEVPINDWDNWVIAYGRGYHYAQQFADIQYTIGDDKWLQDNIFTDAVMDAQVLKARNMLRNFSTLSENNVYGNKYRFTNIEGQWYHSSYNRFTNFNHSTSDMSPLRGTDARVNNIFGEDNVLRFTKDGGVGDGGAGMTGAPIGVENFVDFDILIPSGNALVKGVTLNDNVNTLAYYGNLTPDVWHHKTYTGTNIWVNASQRYLCTDSSNLRVTASNSDIVYLKNVHHRRKDRESTHPQYCIDHYTGIGWIWARYMWGPEDYNTNMVANGRYLGTDFGGQNDYLGFTNWFLPNNSLFDGINDVDYRTPGNSQMINAGTTVVSSTTTEPESPYTDHNQFGIRNSISHSAKSTNYDFLICRKHF